MTSSPPMSNWTPPGQVDFDPLPKRVLDTGEAQYYPAPDYPGYNPSGIQVLGPNVLIRTDIVAKTRASGLILADDTSFREDARASTGVIYAMGKTAWAGYAEHEHPQVGDRVVFTLYAGEVPKLTADGAPYRIMDASCVLGRMIAPEGEPIPSVPGEAA